MTPEPKKKGGARKGAGRKKAPARAVAEAAIAVSAGLDGRSPGGKAHALWLIEQLNAIDPVLIEHMRMHVSSEPYKADRDADEKERARIEQMEVERRINWRIREQARRRFSRLSFEVQSWAHHWFSASEALETKKYLHDKAGHQAVRVINHVHDKPIEMNVNVTLRERFKIAMEKAEKRVGFRH